MICLELFVTFMYIGLFSIGGGYAAMPFIQQQIVESKGWLTLSEFADIITISEMTPGPIAINAATFVGTKLASFPGAVAATLGFILPAVIIVMILAVVYKKFHNATIFSSVFSGIRPAIIGLIAAAGFSIISVTVSNGLPAILLAVTAFILLQTKRISPILIMVISGVIGAVVY